MTELYNDFAHKNYRNELEHFDRWSTYAVIATQSALSSHDKNEWQRLAAFNPKLKVKTLDGGHWLNTSNAEGLIQLLADAH